MAAGDSVDSRNDPRPGSDRKLRLAASSPNIKAIFDANPGGPASSYPQQYTRLPSVVNQPIAEYVPPSGPDPATAAAAAAAPYPPFYPAANVPRIPPQYQHQSHAHVPPSPHLHFAPGPFRVLTCRGRIRRQPSAPRAVRQQELRPRRRCCAHRFAVITHLRRRCRPCRKRRRMLCPKIPSTSSPTCSPDRRATTAVGSSVRSPDARRVWISACTPPRSSEPARLLGMRAWTKWRASSAISDFETIA